MFKQQLSQEYFEMNTTKQAFTDAISLVKINPSTSIAAVIGDPVKHSLSPVIHNAGFKSLGIDWFYIACEVKDGQAKEALEAMKVLDLRGLSVTMPHKTSVATLVDSVSESARALKSVNTVEVSADGSLVGHSTDGDGLVASLQARDVDVAGKDVLILGAGGAARSVIDALSRKDCHQIFIVNRSLETAKVAAELAPGIATAIALTDQSAISEIASQCNIVINATSVGMSKSPDVKSVSPISADLITSAHVVVDLVYHPIQTELLRQAQLRGAQAIDGLGMLVHQAALQQQIWTGLFPSVPDMYQAALQALS
jgi:shikimate dehydrogenase